MLRMDRVSACVRRCVQEKCTWASELPAIQECIVASIRTRSKNACEQSQMHGRRLSSFFSLCAGMRCTYRRGKIELRSALPHMKEEFSFQPRLTVAKVFARRPLNLSAAEGHSPHWNCEITAGKRAAAVKMSLRAATVIREPLDSLLRPPFHDLLAFLLSSRYCV